MADTPPAATSRVKRDSNSSRTSSKTTNVKSLTTNQIREKLADQLSMMGAVIGSFDPVDGFVILINAEEVADAWANVAEANPRVKRVLERYFGGGVYAQAGMSTAMLVIPILTHHKIVPRMWFNPSVSSIEQVEVMVNEGNATLGDLMKNWQEAEASRAAFMESVRNQNMNGVHDPDTANQDHYEAPVS